MKFTTILLIPLAVSACHASPPPTFPPPAVKAEIIEPTLDIHYGHEHSLSETEAIAAAEALAKRLEKYGMCWNRNDLTISFKVNRGILGGVSGVLILSSRKVDVNIYNFPRIIPKFLATPRIKREIHSHFKIIDVGR